MSAAANPTVKDPNLQLIIEMGGDRALGWDPVPPAQLLAPLTHDATLSPSAQKLHAKMFEKTVRFKQGGRRTPYASDGKRPLKLKDLAEELGWEMPKTSKVWAELEAAGYVSRKEGLLCLNGTVIPTKAHVLEPDTPEVTEETLDAFLDMQPSHIREQYLALEPHDRYEALRVDYDAEGHIKLVFADAAYGAREYAFDYRDYALRRWNIHTRKDDGTKKKKRRIVKIIVLELPDDDEAPEELPVQTTHALTEESKKFPVQETPEDHSHAQKFPVQETPEIPVQTAKPMLYNVKTESVQDSHPYVTENREYRVSKYEDAGTEDATAAADLPTSTLTETPQTPTAEQNAAPLSFETLAASKTLSVDKVKSTPEAHPVLRTVGKYFGKVTNAKLRSQFLQLADENEIPSEAVARFLTEKMNEKIGKGEKVFSAGALLQYARSDIRGWISQNRPYLARIAEQEERQAAPAPSRPPESVEPILDPAELQEQLQACEHLAAQRPEYREMFLQRAEELRKQLGKLANRAAG